MLIKHVPVIVHLITSMERGGAQEVLRVVCDKTGQDHKHVIFYMTGENSYAITGIPFGVDVFSLNISGVGSLIKAVFQIRRHIEGIRGFVCLQGWMYHANLLAILVKFVSPRSPIVFSIHNGSDRREFTSTSGFLASRLCGLLSKMAESTIFVSSKSLTSHVAYSKSIVIPNPVKPLKMDNGQLRSREDSLASEVTLACIARLDPIKNIGFMLDMIKQLVSRGLSIRLLMAGEGMSAQNTELLAMLQARGLEDQVELLGVVSDIASVYARADYTILTSKCESFSNVLLESIACGTPFISSDVGIAEVLLSPESLVIKGFDIEDWVDKVQKALHIRKTSRVSKSVREHFDTVSKTYAPMRIADLYADCWAKSLGQ